MINCSLSMIVILLDFWSAGSPWTVNWTSIWSKSHQLCFNRTLPTASYTGESASVCSAPVSYSHFTQPAWGLDLAHLCACGSAAPFYYSATYTQTSERLCGSAPCPPAVVKINLGCVTCGCHWWRVRERRQSGSECTTRGRKNVVSVTDSAAQWCADIVYSLPPAAAGLLPCAFTPRETFVTAVQICLN